MKLCHFPNILKGFWEIAEDQPHPNRTTGNPIPQAEVPNRWLKTFKLLEEALTKLDDKTPRDLGISPNALVDPTVADMPAWLSVALPGNDDDKIILFALGYDSKQIKQMQRIYCEFFDGKALESLKQP